MHTCLTEETNFNLVGPQAATRRLVCAWVKRKVAVPSARRLIGHFACTEIAFAVYLHAVVHWALLQLLILWLRCDDANDMPSMSVWLQQQGTC